jgi:hypothetical protein
MGEGFFLGLSGYKGQSALCFLEGRSSRFFFSSLLFVQPCRGKFLFILQVFGSVFVFSGLIWLLDFLIYSVITVKIVFFVVEILFPFLCSSSYCKRCVLFVYYIVSCLYILGVLGPWEFSGGPGHIFSVRM